MRKLIAGMKISLDGKFEGPDGVADWVDAWSEDYDLTSQIDACVLGGGMYPGYERYWTSVREAPDTPAWITGSAPTLAEIEWARFAARTPHHVLSNTLTSAAWANTRFVTSPDDIAALKRQKGGSIYLIGGGRTTASLIDAGLVDELRLLVYPLIAGEGKPLFGSARGRHSLELVNVHPLTDGRVSMVYTLGRNGRAGPPRPS
jgi:dihydrofolate reductase